MSEAEGIKNNNIAIIGLGCRFPGANNPDEFWQLLANGVDAITEVPEDRWDLKEYFDSKGGPGKMTTRWGGFLKNIDQFDPEFFKISPREAEKMDPQQRLLLECAWEALEHASINPKQLSGTKAGVFVGISHSNYEKLLFPDSKNFDVYSATGNSLTIAANRLSYFFNLKGPSMAIDTACSSSLVAVHQACQSLRLGETNMCLVGGVNVILAPEGTISFSQGGMMAADGRCKTFSADADGYSRAEGCGMVVLKRMEDALRDGDHICAVLRGSAVNQDGASNGLTAPHGPSQVDVISDALDNAQVKPGEISYVEAHGTGTSLGDPIEMESIKQALMPERQSTETCYVGSVKTNIGHLESAAGIAGLIKVVLSLQHKEIPSQLHLKEVNPLIKLKSTPFAIATKHQSWQPINGSRLAGLSSFGFGGTNCHVIVEESPREGSQTKQNDFPSYQFNRQRYWLKSNGSIQQKNIEPKEEEVVVQEMAQNNIEDAFNGKAEKEQISILTDYLQELVANVLGSDKSDVDINQNLNNMGLDSIMAVEIREQVKQDLKVDVPLVEFMTGTHIAQLAGLFIEYIKKDSAKFKVTKVDQRQGPLTYGQRALWFIYQSDPQSPVYNVPVPTRIRSEVNVDALRLAYQQLLNRHPALRTTFSMVKGDLRQTVHENQTIDFLQIDAASWDQTKIDQHVMEAYKQPFNLETGPLIRVRLFTKNPTDHILLINIHHIVCDGWSVWMMLDELRKLYEANVNNNSLKLKAIDYSYLDYVHWQHDYLNSKEGVKHWNYWKDKLSGELPVLNLPTDRPRPAVQTFTGDTHSFSLSEELTNKIRSVAQAQGVSLYTFLLAAYKILLHRYSSQKDICVGTFTRNRKLAEFSNVVGYFVNPIVMRSEFTNSMSFKAFLEQLRQTVLDGINNQDYPLSLLVERLKPERDPSRTPFFDVAFILQRPQQFKEVVDLLKVEDQTRVNWGLLEIEKYRIPEQGAWFDMTLAMVESEKNIVGDLTFNKDLFDDSTITRMMESFQILLKEIVDDQTQPISQYSLLDAKTGQHMLLPQNDMNMKPLCVHQLFEEQVLKTPKAIAVEDGNEKVTYAQLNKRSNQLAHYLKKKGIKQETLVGICLNRSIDMIVSLLAVLKAGGAYVPLDPKLPEKRLSLLLEDSKISVLLTEESLYQPYWNNAVLLDSDKSTIKKESDHNPNSEVALNNLAYIIYTSGTSGQPKGVMIEHQSLTNYIQYAVKEYGITENERMLQFSSVSFDAAAEEIYTALISGASLILRNEEMILSADSFLKQCEDWRISTLDFPTAYWHKLCSQMISSNLSMPSSIKKVLIGGERVDPKLVNDWQQQFSDQIEFYNTYGPTETTIVATTYKIKKIKEKQPHYLDIPIGRPVANTTTYILDSNLKPVPTGVAGELVIGGAALARGYLHRDELTAKSFINHSFDGQNTVRLYKTGDVARFLPDGNIEFVGRVDDQVKIRGFRIELGEIQNALMLYPNIKEAFVTVDKGQTGISQLLAYVVATEEQIDVSEVKHYLKERLPGYMIPSSITVLDHLPISALGKVDRKKLPKPQQQSAAEYVAPSTMLEKQLAEIWSEILDIDKVGVHDNFFDLGGNSLNLIELIDKCKSLIKVDIPLVDLFHEPTIANIASVLIRRSEGKSSACQFINLEKEAVLPEMILSDKPMYDPMENPKNVFLTGATGFLGIYLLKELLQTTKANIYCLVRPKGSLDSMGRIIECIEQFRMHNQLDLSRVIPVNGDLSKDNLGLDVQEFDRLAEEIDVVYHNAAQVSFAYPYAKIKKTTVLGVKSIIQFACHKKVKALHYVSTTGIFSSKQRTYDEDTPIEEQQHLSIFGYEAAKWVAEKLIKMAGEQGLPVTIYRPGLIIGDNQTGASKRDEFAYLLIAGCAELGFLPKELYSDKYNLTTVDYVAKSLVYLSTQSFAVGQTYHLNNLYLSKMKDILRAFEQPNKGMKIIPYIKWIQKVKDHVKVYPNSSFTKIMPVLVLYELYYLGASESEKWELWQRRFRNDYQCKKTASVLSEAGLTCSAPDYTLFKKLNDFNKQPVCEEQMANVAG